VQLNYRAVGEAVKQGMYVSREVLSGTESDDRACGDGQGAIENTWWHAANFPLSVSRMIIEGPSKI
jgi:hypothetical protein